MRWIEHCSTKILAETFEVEERTIWGYLRELKRTNRLQNLNLPEHELEEIFKAISLEAPLWVN